MSRWQTEISARVNEHSALLEELTKRLAGRLVITDLAVSLGMKLVESEETGLRSLWKYEAICALMPGQDDGAVQEALHELEDHGFLTTHATLSEPISHVLLCYEIYPVFDPVTLGYDTAADARQLAAMLLEDEERGSIPKLFEDIGWPRRRFNPALAYLLQFFEERRIGRELQADFPTRWVLVDSRERFRLKQFIREVT